jgi:hypothetical protein
MTTRTRSRCPICHKRRIAQADTVCRTCRRFISTYIATGRHRLPPQPAGADVALVMAELGVDQRTAVLALGGRP